MTDLSKLDVRAGVCLNCHLGSVHQAVYHRLLGAGHPRLTFELDTFTALEPMHWVLDKDYGERKGSYDPAAAWLIGQIERSKRLLQMLSTQVHTGKGLSMSPELSRFYCYSCHHDLKERQWKTHDYDGSPGELRLNLSSLHIVERALRVLNPNLSKNISNQVQEFAKDQSLSRLKGLQSLFEKINVKNALDISVSKKLLLEFATFGSEVSHPPYEIAEQIAMAISSLVSKISPRAAIHKKEIDGIYVTLENPETFKGPPFNEACRVLCQTLK